MEIETGWEFLSQNRPEAAFCLIIELLEFREIRGLGYYLASLEMETLSSL